MNNLTQKEREIFEYISDCLQKNGFAPSKIYKIALKTFENIYSGEVIYKWLESFINRFFTQQFKRSCLPDGVKVDEISFSPRTDWKMPSDMNRDIWLEDLRKIKR
jgi:NAD+ synthase (glutamine-hydrolysing)